MFGNYLGIYLLIRILRLIGTAIGFISTPTVKWGRFKEKRNIKLLMYAKLP